MAGIFLFHWPTHTVHQMTSPLDTPQTLIYPQDQYVNASSLLVRHVCFGFLKFGILEYQVYFPSVVPLDPRI